MVVLVLVSIMMAVSVPRFRTAILTDPLKRSARQIIGTVQEARLRAAESPQGCGLIIKIDEGSFGLSCPQPRRQADARTGDIDEDGDDIETSDDDLDEPYQLLTIGDPARIKSVWNENSTRFTIGEVTLWIDTDGLIEPSVINLSDGRDEIGLTISPFISDIKIDDEAVVPENFTGSEALL